MTKRNPVKKFQHQDRDQEFAFGFSDFMESSFEGEMFSGMMNGLIQASSQQMQAAVELTKMAIAKSSSQTLTDVDIFATFKKASQVVHDASPLKTLWEQLSRDQ